MKQLINSRPYPNTTALHVAFLSIFSLCFYVLVLFAAEAGVKYLEYACLVAFAVFLFREIYTPLNMTVATDKNYMPPSNNYMPTYPIRISKDNANYAVDLGVLKFIALSADVLKTQDKFNNICGHEYAHIYFKDGIYVNAVKLLLYINLVLIIFIFLTYPFHGESMIVQNQYLQLLINLTFVFLFNCLYARKTIHEREYNADYFSLSINGFSFLNYIKSMSHNSRIKRPNFVNIFSSPFSHPSIENRIKKLEDPKHYSTKSILNLALIFILLSGLMSSSVKYLNSFSSFMPDIGDGFFYQLLVDNDPLRSAVETTTQLFIYYYICSEILVLSLSRKYVWSLTKLIVSLMLIWGGIIGLGFISFEEIRSANEVQQNGTLESFLILLRNELIPYVAFILAAFLAKIIFRFKVYKASLTGLIFISGILIIYIFGKTII